MIRKTIIFIKVLFKMTFLVIKGRTAEEAGKEVIDNERALLAKAEARLAKAEEELRILDELGAPSIEEALERAPFWRVWHYRVKMWRLNRARTRWASY